MKETKAPKGKTQKRGKGYCFNVLTIIDGTRQEVDVYGINEEKARQAFNMAHPGAEISSIKKA